MRKLGKKSALGHVVKDLNPIHISGKPTRMPFLSQEGVVICGLDIRIKETLYLCETLKDMQALYDKYAQGWALDIHWYRGTIRTISPESLRPALGVIRNIIENQIPHAPEEVKEAIEEYAKGNPGIAKVLAVRARRFNFTSEKEVEDLVGWPLSDHSIERTGEIWDRFK